jgi:hypothetical protein
MVLLTGCSIDDPKAEFDSLVDDVWLGVNGDQQRNAVEFLSQGGQHCDVPGSGQTTSIDKEHVLPLMQKLQNELKVEPQALISIDEDFAWQIIVKLPMDPLARNAVQKALNEADARYPGTIETEWGHKWLAINFLESEVEAAE